VRNDTWRFADPKAKGTGTILASDGVAFANARLSFYRLSLISPRGGDGGGRNYARRNSGEQGEMFFIYVRPLFSLSLLPATTALHFSWLF
jgi:hypothetical protein